MPAALRSFGARNKLELIDHRRGPDRTEIYRLSCTNREQRPQFLTIEVRADYLRCGHVVFTAEELLRDRVPVSGLAGHGRGCFLADQGGQHDAQAQTTRANRIVVTPRSTNADSSVAQFPLSPRKADSG